MAQTVMRADDFINSLGIVAHLEGAAGSEPALVKSELSFLGITNLRVEAPFTNLSTYVALGQVGVKLDVITTSSNIPSQIAYFNSIAPYISSIEGLNEINSVAFSYDNLTGPAADEAFQADLYTAIKADPALAGIPVLSFSLSSGASETGYGSVAASANDGNVHAYSSGGGSPNQSIVYQKGLVTLTPGEPDYLTETGYYTLNDGTSGVSGAVQAVYLVDSLLDGAADGFTKTFLYELMDETYTDPNNSEGHYGVFGANGVAKPAAYAIHNLTTLLTDIGSNASTFTPASQSISVSGLGAVNGFSEIFAKSSGEIDVALWAEPNLYNPATGVEEIFSSTVTLSLGGSFNVLVYDPISGLAPIEAATDVTSIQVSLGDDALIVELTPVKVYNLAAPSFVQTGGGGTLVHNGANWTLNLGTVTQGASVTPVSIGVENAGATGQYADDLSGNFSLVGSGFTVAGANPFSGVGNGESVAGGLTVNAATETLGLHSETITLSPTSSDGGYSGALPNITLTITDDVQSSPGTAVATSAGAGGPVTAVPTNPVGPTAPPTTPLTAPPAAAIDGTPLQLGLSEDASGAGVQYSITIDGALVVSAANEYASHSTGQDDAVNVPAGIDQGTHVVTVTLLNPSGVPASTNALYVNSISVGNVETLLDTQLNAATPSVSYTVTKSEPSSVGPITSETVNASSLPAAFLTTTSPSINSFGQMETRNTGAGAAQLELAGQQTAMAGIGPDNFIERAGIQAETVVFGFNRSLDTVDLVGYSLADPNNAIFQNGTTETIQLTGGNAIDLLNTSGIPEAAFNWGGAVTAVPTNPVGPTAPPTTPLTAPPGAPTDGTPLQLGLSEDASGAGVQYSITIDGALVVSAANEYASHSIGQGDAVNVPAGIDQGTHVVTVTLLNPSEVSAATNALYVNSISVGNVETLLDTQLNAATPSVSYTVTNPEPSSVGPITSETVNASSLPAAFLTTTTPSINSFGQTETRNTGAGAAQLELAGQQTAMAGIGPDNFIERAGIQAETVVFGFNRNLDTVNLVGYSLADPNNAIFQNGTTETIQLKGGNAIDLLNTSGIPKAAFNWG